MNTTARRDIFKEFVLDSGLVGRQLVMRAKKGAEESLGPVDEEKEVIGGFIDCILQVLIVSDFDEGVDDWGVSVEVGFVLVVFAQMLYDLVCFAVDLFGQSEEL